MKMGSFDTLSDEGCSVQVKCFNGNLDVYHVGDKVPELHYYHQGYRRWDDEDQLDTYTIVLNPYHPAFALIKDRIFIGFTGDEEETYPPYVWRWGELRETT